ncbi:hypothetical protein KM176_16470 [Pseudooceanicola sp. CBS1P-1]|uniref:Uncharacterized protein n=1 Tax=Pseudooceanicola albus TaxID=2692189 RepID=A0A6L7G6H2_9RHOB|nr:MULTISPECIES: hypothetical protein [Pseudooceanicola]MBT9385470.1 hypothetical protein [Pseudooceanicola endophyticus]MXN19118.1 hypothetical protein [Pseudooceanicola albus]
MEAAAAAQVVGAGASAASLLGQAKAEKQNSEINSYIGRTRALQTDTTARQSLSSELGSMRTAMAANGDQPGVGTFEMMQELRTTRDRERRIQFGNEMQSSWDSARKGRNAMQAGRLGFITKMAKGGQSMFDLYQMMGS